MVVCFAIRANKAEDTRIFGADKQAADAANFAQYGAFPAGLRPMTARYALMNPREIGGAESKGSGLMRLIPWLFEAILSPQALHEKPIGAR
jgi:hypothetical protein